jgi:preprotein translocase subunit YajC
MTGLALVAQAGGAQSAPSQNLLQMLFLFGPLILIFYFLILRPQQKQRKAHDAMVKALVPGDRVVTTGGIVGTLTRAEGTILKMKIATGVEINVLRNAIAGKTEEETP